MTLSPAVSRLIGDEYPRLAEEALGLAVFSEPVMDLGRADLVLLVAYLFRRLRTSALPVERAVKIEPSPN